MSKTVRVSNETHERVVRLSRATGQRQQSVVEAAVAAYEADVFWSAFESGYAALAEDATAWAEVRAERAAEARALADGLAEPEA